MYFLQKMLTMVNAGLPNTCLLFFSFHIQLKSLKKTMSIILYYKKTKKNFDNSIYSKFKKLLGVYSSISISSCRIRHISNGCCRTLHMFSILEYHANSSLFNEFVCKLDFFWHDWASLKQELYEN
jgi:hypothetical protein